MVAACPFPEPRGTPTRILRMAEALAGRGHEVHVVSYHLGQPIDSPSIKIHRIPNIKTYQKRTPGPSCQKLLVLDPLLVIKLIALLRRYEIDLIHAHHFEGMLASWYAHKLFNKPLVFDIHTLLESELPYYGSGFPLSLKKHVGRLFDRIVPHFANQLIAVSDEIKEKLIKQHGYTKRQIPVIPNGMELELFGDIGVSGCSKEGQSKTLVFSGNLSLYQRIDLLLEAFREVCNQRSDVHLKMLTASDFSSYEVLARELGVRERIDVKECQLEDLPNELASATIALNPRTECDGLPQKLLNYMAAGIPVVSFEGSAKHFLHGQHGLVVENGNTKEFADAIVKILDHPERGKKYGEDARSFVLNEMSWDKTAANVEEIYDQILCETQSNEGRVRP
ncbi:MAG: glycosyltransferase family 4 protein [Nitrospiria bacterium]